MTATLGTGQDEQIDRRLGRNYREHFMLHYNFPPFSVGEAGRFGFTSVAKSVTVKLAWRAIHPVMPSKGRIPLHHACGFRSHRIQWFVLDGDRLRDSRCDDGCRCAVAAPVAGIAMGLIKEGDRYAVLVRHLG